MNPESNKTKNKSTIVKYILIGLLAAVIAIGAFILYNSQKNNTPYKLTSYAMGTYVNQTVYGENAETAVAEANSAITNLDNILSWRNENSDIYNINQNAGNVSVQVNSSTLDTLEVALDVANATNGALDPTVLPYTSLWGFDESRNIVPAPEELENAQNLVGFSHLKVDENSSTAFLDSAGSEIDLGAIGKGAACDTAIQVYKENGVKSAIVAVGGSVGLLGNKDYNSDWSIGIRDPYLALEGDTSSTMGTISTGEGFISTSGIYEQCFWDNGDFYHHILDPKTGYPVENDLMSVTIVCDNGTLSDALSTACFVLGKDASKEVLQHYNAEAIFIDKDKNVYTTDGIKDDFTITNGDYVLCS